MTPQQVAMVAATERDLAEQFEALGLDDPQGRAARHIRWLQRKGWRIHPELADSAPPRPRVADPAVAQAALAEAREVVAAKYGNRPELDGTDR